MGNDKTFACYIIALSACCALLTGAGMGQAQDKSTLQIMKEEINNLQNAVRVLNQDTAKQVELTSRIDELVAKTVEYEAIKKSAEDYAGIGFGIALGYRRLDNCSECVKEAQLVNGVVRITEEQDDIIGFMLETHYFIPFGKSRLQGIGPYVSFDPGSESDPMRSVGAGIMYGGRYDAKKTKSFNIGIGWAVDNKIKVLGDGILANQPLPAGEVEIRYKKVSRHGLMALLSFSF